MEDKGDGEDKQDKEDMEHKGDGEDKQDKEDTLEILYMKRENFSSTEVYYTA